MTGDIETDSRAFIAKVKRKAGKFGLRIERVDADAGIVAALDDQLLVVFTEDHDGLQADSVPKTVLPPNTSP